MKNAIQLDKQLARIGAAVADRRCSGGSVKKIIQGLKTLGPYMAIELLLPGGTLIALLVWLVNRRKVTAQLSSRDGNRAAVATPWRTPISV